MSSRPTIIAGLGFSGGRAQLHTVPPYVPATVLTVVIAFLADKKKWRGPFILILMPLAIAGTSLPFPRKRTLTYIFTLLGYALAIRATTNNQRYAAVFLMAAGV